MRRVLAALPILGALATACSVPPLHTVRWQTAQIASRGDQVGLDYAIDVCEQIDHVEVDYGTAVTLTIYASATDRPCLGIRFVHSVKVPLRFGFGHARFRDGAETAAEKT
jgi:hypothetical protein